MFLTRQKRSGLLVFLGGEGMGMEEVVSQHVCGGRVVLRQHWHWE